MIVRAQITSKTHLLKLFFSVFIIWTLKIAEYFIEDLGYFPNYFGNPESCA